MWRFSPFDEARVRDLASHLKVSPVLAQVLIAPSFDSPERAGVFLDAVLSDPVHQGLPADIQVTRRLRALLEELAELVLPENRSAIDEELRHLDATVTAVYPNTTDLAAAMGGNLCIDRS